MSAVEELFLNFSFGYTWSKVLAYLVFPLLGILIWFVSRKRIHKPWLRYTLLLICVVLPFALYFAVYPIYEGDFSNHPVKPKNPSELNNVRAPKLVVVAIPNCPFCKLSIQRMLELKDRHPEIQLEYRVCVNDSIADQAITNYRTLTGNRLLVVHASNSKELANAVNLSFPTYVLITRTGIQCWSNDNFGVGALDEVVEAFGK